jgi:hypothetical protein
LALFSKGSNQGLTPFPLAKSGLGSLLGFAAESGAIKCATYLLQRQTPVTFQDGVSALLSLEMAQLFDRFGVFDIRSIIATLLSREELSTDVGPGFRSDVLKWAVETSNFDIGQPLLNLAFRSGSISTLQYLFEQRPGLLNASPPPLALASLEGGCHYCLELFDRIFSNESGTAFSHLPRVRGERRINPFELATQAGNLASLQLLRE